MEGTLKKLPLRYSGYASIFNIMDRGGDVVRPGAFEHDVNRDRVIPLKDGHEGPVIGKVEAWHEDDKGLFVDLLLCPEAGAERISALIQMGAMGGLSFGYSLLEYSQGEGKILHRIELQEVSLVAWPMHPMARVAL